MKKKVIAIGNAGGNIADSIRRQGIGIEDTEFVYLDTDPESLFEHGVETDSHITLAADMTGLEEALTKEIVKGVDIVILTAGLGGTTGSRCSVAVGRVARKAGIETVAFVSTPFRFEGEKRCATARGECLEELETVFNEVFVQENEDLDDSLNLSDMDAKLCQEYARRFQ